MKKRKDAETEIKGLEEQKRGIERGAEANRFEPFRATLVNDRYRGVAETQKDRQAEIADQTKRAADLLQQQIDWLRDHEGGDSDYYSLTGSN